ncbi:hypothetical protein D3C80_1453840 [compost metagenome]
MKRHICRDQAHHRRDLKTGAAVERGQLAKDMHPLRWDRHFFLRFTQCGNDGRTVFSIGFTAGEGHLTRMFTQ